MQTHGHKYTTMFLALLTMITALSISAVQFITQWQALWLSLPQPPFLL